MIERQAVLLESFLNKCWRLILVAISQLGWTSGIPKVFDASCRYSSSISKRVIFWNLLLKVLQEGLKIGVD